MASWRQGPFRFNLNASKAPSLFTFRGLPGVVRTKRKGAHDSAAPEVIILQPGSLASPRGRAISSLLLTPPTTQKANPYLVAPTTSFLRLTASGEERAKSCRTQKAVTSPARSEACSGEKRNKWQGPASGGKDAVYVGFDLEQA
jgi:hypothetical protein